MKTKAQSLRVSPVYGKLIEWSKLIAVTGAAQVIVQAVSFLSGILVIRLLPTNEYAVYTLANTMLGTMTLLADGGITAGVMAQGGKVWRDREKLGIVFATGFDLRKKFALASLLLATPVLLYLLHQHGASWLISVLVVLSLIPAFITTLSSQLLEINLKLHQDIAALQKIQVGVNMGRLGLLALTIFIFPWAFIALLAAGFPQIWGNRQLAQVSDHYIKAGAKPDDQIKKEIVTFVKRLLPGVIYYCLAGQITVWLISIFGTTSALAQIGALARLAMVLNVFSVLFNTLVTPRFARMVNEAKPLLNRYLQIVITLVALCVAIVVITWLFSNQILWFLGPQYQHLQSALLLNIMGGCLALVAGAVFNLYISRGWAIDPRISIPVEIAAVVAGVLLFDVSTIQGVLLLNILIAAVQALMHLTFGLIKVTQAKAVATELKG